ncbi:MAG: DegT/DnrJ/EryC1/StrS family aminotransferase [Nitrospinae bacterium]|nr:DegT/DnrJ/EryC1/StrS family aminotransferase [Nitrospinota bacterium]
MAVADIITSGYISQGSAVEKFESEMAEYIGVKGGAAVSSGTAALHLSLKALGVKEGDDVAIPSYICPALLNAVHYIGANPLLIDIDNSSYDIDPSDLRRRLTKRTKAIIVPHIFGLPADIEEILNIGIPVIEDCAQSVGASYKGKKVGSFGICAILSFYATKVMTTGEGGMVLSNSDNILDKVRDLREYDHKPEYVVRYNYKMTDMQAALGISQLKRLDSFISKRKYIAGLYNKRFSELGIAIPSNPEKEHIYFRYVIRNMAPEHQSTRAPENKGQRLEEDLKFFEDHGVKCMRPIYKPIHKYLKPVLNSDSGLEGFPETDRAWDKLISIPIYPSLSDAEVNYIIAVVEKWRDRTKT